MTGRLRARGAVLLDPGIEVVEAILTTRCNLRCRYCDQGRPTPTAMPADTLDEAVRRLVSSKLVRPQLTLYGGEPLLAPSLVRRALNRVQEWAPPWMKPDVKIVTNGTLLDEEALRLLASCKVHVTLSFDGIAAAQDARAPGTFQALDRLLLRWRRAYPAHFRNRFSVNMTLTPANVPHLSESFRYFLSRDVRDVGIAPAAERAQGWTRRQARELARQLAAVRRISIAELRRSGRIPFRALRAADAKAPTRGGPACGCGVHRALCVDVDGRVAPCPAFIQSVLPDRAPIHRRIAAALGGMSVFDSDVPEALLRRERRARTLRSLRLPAARRGWNRRCARCAARASCLICPAAIALAGGRVPQFHCDLNRLLARHRVALSRESSQSPNATT